MGNYIQLFVRILLIPISLVYALLTEFRNILFDLGFLPAYKSKLPVISVGNISVGGTGKTPFTIWLANHLNTRFPRIAIVSRGYKRRGKGLKIVAEQGNILSDVHSAGDEPMLMAHKVKQAFILVAENRKKALRHIELTDAADVVILDDAFQHRWVRRKVDIVLWRSGSFWDYWPLPTGRLRENFWRLKRATYLLLRNQETPTSHLPFLPADRQFKIYFELDTIVDEFFAELGRLDQWPEKRIVAFAGIAHPQAYFKMLRHKGFDLAAAISFADHYRYKENDVQRLLQICRAKKVAWLFCTEKDLVKIRDFLPVLETEMKMAHVSIAAVTLRVNLEDEQKFMNDLIKRLTKK